MGYWNDPDYQRRRQAEGKPGQASMRISRQSWHDPESWHDPGGPSPGTLPSLTMADLAGTKRNINPEEAAAVEGTFGGDVLEKIQYPYGRRNLAQERRGDLVQRFAPSPSAMSGLPGDQEGAMRAVDSGVRDVGSRLKGLYTREDGTVGLKEPDETYRSATVMALNEDIARAFGIGALGVLERREIFRKMIDEDIDRRMAERRMAVLEKQTAAFSGESLQGMMSNPDLVQGQVGKSGMSFRKSAPQTPLSEKRLAYKMMLVKSALEPMAAGENPKKFRERVQAVFEWADEVALRDLPDEGGEAGAGDKEAVFTPWSQVSAAQRARIYQKRGIRTEKEYNQAAEKMGYR